MKLLYKRVKKGVTEMNEDAHHGASYNRGANATTSVFAMTDNGVNYNYTKEGGFSTAGTHTWHVTCSKTGLTRLTSTNTLTNAPYSFSAVHILSFISNRSYSKRVHSPQLKIIS